MLPKARTPVHNSRVVKVVRARVNLALGSAAQGGFVHLVACAVCSGVARGLAHGLGCDIVRGFVGAEAAAGGTAAPRTTWVDHFFEAHKWHRL